MSLPRSFAGLVRLVVVSLLLVVGASCASLNATATSATSGRYTSSAVSFTFLSFDLPSPALEMARNNAADMAQPNTLVEKETVFPYLGRLDWILDIICVRYARVTGTWGDPPEAAATE